MTGTYAINMHGPSVKFTLGKNVTLTEVRKCCAAIKNEIVEVEPLHRCEPGIDVKRVSDFKLVLPAHVSLRFSPQRKVHDRRKLAAEYRKGVVFGKEELERQQHMAAGFPRLAWPSRYNKWVEERAEDIIFKTGDHVVLFVHITDCKADEWVLDLLDKITVFFEASSIIKYTARNKALLRRINKK